MDRMIVAGRRKALEPHQHGRAYAGAAPDDGTDRGAYCPACSHLAGDNVWPCAKPEPAQPDVSDDQFRCRPSEHPRPLP